MSFIKSLRDVEISAVAVFVVVGVISISLGSFSALFSSFDSSTTLLSVASLLLVGSTSFLSSLALLAGPESSLLFFGGDSSVERINK